MVTAIKEKRQINLDFAEDCDKIITASEALSKGYINGIGNCE
jgi:hypothetical protein